MLNSHQHMQASYVSAIVHKRTANTVSDHSDGVQPLPSTINTTPNHMATTSANSNTQRGTHINTTIVTNNNITCRRAHAQPSTTGTTASTTLTTLTAMMTPVSTTTTQAENIYDDAHTNIHHVRTR